MIYFALFSCLIFAAWTTDNHNCNHNIHIINTQIIIIIIIIMIDRN